MKTCHVCGTQVEDNVLICPDCGAEVVGSTGGLTLKANSPERKRSADRMGTTVSTGSGLTNILKRDDEAEGNGEFYGSIPTSLSYTVIQGDYSSKKKGHRKVSSAIFKIVFLAAIAFGVYYLFTHFLLKKEGAETYEDALDIYVEAINEQDAEKMQTIIPSYVFAPSTEAQKLIDAMGGAKIEKCTILDHTIMDSTDVNALQDNIKLQLGKTVDLKEVCTVRVQLVFSGGTALPREAQIEFMRIKKGWFLYIDIF